jgi:beta-glucosidase
VKSNRVRSLIAFAALLSAANLFAQSNAVPTSIAAPQIPLPGASQGSVTISSQPGAAYTPATRSNPTNWLSRHEGFVKQAKKGGVDILFMGDSITDNWRSRGSNVWNKVYEPRHAANFGIGGDRTQHVLWRIENGELNGVSPRVTVLMIGTNNSNDDSPEDIATGIKRIIGGIRQHCPGTKILLLGIFPRGGPRKNSDGSMDDGIKRMEVIHAVNKIIAKFDNGASIRYLDIGPKFLGTDGKVHKDIMPDLLHPNEQGYQIWVDAMNPTLDEMMK